MTLTGKCNCGDVKFSLEGDPAMTVMCACDGCRKQASNPTGQVLYVYPSQNIKVDDPQNQLGKYNNTNTESGKPKVDMFCKGCGSNLLGWPTSFGDVWSVRLTAIDNWQKLKIQVPEPGYHDNLKNEVCGQIKGYL